MISGVLVAYPATIGSRELPSPSGTYKVKGVAYNPIYYYDPDKNFVQGDNNEKLRLPPGPNNPVGSVFIALAARQRRLISTLPVRAHG